MWTISKASYYGDWLTIPILCLIALASDIAYHGVTFAAVAAFFVGVFIWSFVEYVMHRWVFHRLYRREHWIHHIRPGAYVGVPAWQTTIIFTLVLGGCLGSLGANVGAGLFLGIASGYLLYIWAHDRFHNGALFTPGSYWDDRACCHQAHHDREHFEMNFGVVTPAWDMLLGTYHP